MKRDALDAAVSDLVRECADWRCERCNKYFPPGPSRRGLHNSHFYGRGGKSSRYDLENCDSLCYGCHKFMERARDEYRAFKRKKLGDEPFDALVLRANKPRKWLKHEIDEMKRHYKSELERIQSMRAMGEIGYIGAQNYE